MVGFNSTFGGHMIGPLPLCPIFIGSLLTHARGDIQPNIYLSYWKQWSHMHDENPFYIFNNI